MRFPGSKFTHKCISGRVSAPDPAFAPPDPLPISEGRFAAGERERRGRGRRERGRGIGEGKEGGEGGKGEGGVKGRGRGVCVIGVSGDKRPWNT